MRTLGIVLAAGILVAAVGLAADTTDLQKIERRIAKEPAYTGRPLYGLLVFGPEMRTRFWLVLDKTKPDADRYDVLYADLNGNGDLSEAAERFVGEAEGNDVRFHLPDFKDPESARSAPRGVTHTAFSLRVSAGPSPTVMVSMKWRGLNKLGGGYPEDPDNGYMKFALKTADAPILWANGDGPFRFQRWYSGKLTIGAADDFKVFMGQQGIGGNSFCAFQQHLLPDAEGVQATLIFRDAQGKELRTVNRLNDRC
jgi:hypothetical protein